MSNTVITQAVTAALEEQPWFTRRKDTIAAVAGTVLQLLNVVAVQATGWPEWAALLIAIAAGVAQVIVHAATPGAITPSMSGRLEASAPVDPVPDEVQEIREGLAIAQEHVGEHR